jgi:predicted Fe-Mo cluster-binding NifX family protein
MKIAVPTRNNFVDEHFGHCEEYTVFTINDDKKIEKTEILPSPQGCGCKSNIAEILKNLGVSVMLAGNMGAGALNVLNYFGIEVYRGCSGNVREIAESFLKGQIEDSGIGCQTHEHHQHHGHSEDGHICDN